MEILDMKEEAVDLSLQELTSRRIFKQSLKGIHAKKELY